MYKRALESSGRRAAEHGVRKTVNPSINQQAFGGSSFGGNTFGVQQSTYPVDVVFPQQETYNRVWAIPVIGILIKYISIIPQIIMLYILGAVVYVAQLVLWAFVLFGGQYPEWGYSLVGGTLRLGLRTAAFVLGLTDKYPGFSLSDMDDGGARLVFNGPPATNRLFAIPVIGILARYIMLIPHLIIVYVLGLVVYALQLVIWVFVLFTGQYPSWAQSLVGGYLRWVARVFSFLLGLTDAYPPFRLEA